MEGAPSRPHGHSCVNAGKPAADGHTKRNVKKIGEVRKHFCPPLHRRQGEDGIGGHILSTAKGHPWDSPSHTNKSNTYPTAKSPANDAQLPNELPCFQPREPADQQMGFILGKSPINQKDRHRPQWEKESFWPRGKVFPQSGLKAGRAIKDISRSVKKRRTKDRKMDREREKGLGAQQTQNVWKRGA